MDFGFTQEELDFRAEVEEFAKRELPSDWNDQVVSWPGAYGTIPGFEPQFQEVTAKMRRKLAENGWNRLSWPKEYGGEGSVMKAAIVPIIACRRAAWLSR
ncbi:MAG: acyl-CoA dehydrogenase family protein [Planctomycetota bacterium]